MSLAKSDHFNGKKFFDPEGDNLKSFWAVLKWKITADAADWPEHVPNKNYPVGVISTNEKVIATFINHATYLLQFHGLNVLTDPVYSERVSPFSFAGPKRAREAGIPFDFLPAIDVVTVSHNHYDHLDLETLKLLDKKFHPLFIVPLGDDKLLKEAGIQNVKAVDWWEAVKVKDVIITFAPSKHWSARGLGDKNESLWGSYMIESPDTKIYHAGDTGYGKHFSEISKRLGVPDLALLPIGAYKPRWFMKHHHMNPEDAVQAHFDLGAKKSAAMHFGTFQLTDEGIDDPVKELDEAKKAKNMSTEFIVLDQGQALTINR